MVTVELTPTQTAHLEGLLIGAMATLEEKARARHTVWKDEAEEKAQAILLCEKLSEEYGELLDTLHRELNRQGPGRQKENNANR